MANNKIKIPPKAIEILVKHGRIAFSKTDPYSFLMSKGLGESLEEKGYDPKFVYDKIIEPLAHAFIKAKQTQFLTKLQNAQNAQNEEIFQIKPNVYGVGVNLKALYRKLINRIRLILKKP